MAIDMLAEGLIDEKTAVMRIEPKQLDELLYPIIDPRTEKDAYLIVKGLPAGPGAACGVLVFTAADAVASFGTNDLTQLTFGFSRDDIGGFMNEYLDQKLLAADPFQTIDQDGVGQLIRMSVEKGRATRPNLKIGICGEQGGDPASVDFCYKTGLTYVSCSPFRVPIARLAAAQAAIKAGMKK